MKRAKTGGRQKGTPNKVNAQLREQLQKMWGETCDLVVKNKDISQLKPNERVDFFLKLTSYILPKPMAIPQDDEGNSIAKEIMDIIKATT